MKILILENDQKKVKKIKNTALKCDFLPSLEFIEGIQTLNEIQLLLSISTPPHLIIANTTIAGNQTIDLLSQLDIGYTIPIIFITDCNDCILDTFKFHVIDYILKPYFPSDLEQALRKFSQLIQLRLVKSKSPVNGTYKKRFLITYGNKLIMQDIQSIAYFFSDRKKVFLVNKLGEKHKIDYKLSQLEQILNPQTFFRLNRKYIINIDSITEIGVQNNQQVRVMLSDSRKRLEVSHSRLNDFKIWAEA